MHFENLSPRAALIIEMIGGLIAGLVLAAPIYVLLQALSVPYPEWIALMVYPLATAIGVRVIGKRLLNRGRVWHAVVGAYVPLMIIAIVAAPASFQPYPIIAAAVIILPPIFAALAFNRFSRSSDVLDDYDDEVDLLAYHEAGWEDEV
jgi:hypothetical protein